MPYTFKHGDRPLEGITVQRAVGRGGFGEVYYALTDSGKQVALKYLRENPEIELRGIGHVMNLKSPYLISIFDVRRNPANEPFVIMEYVGGPSLRELMSAEPGGFSVQKAAFFLKGIAKGLSYLHERGIVHRDLKPANIFYDDGYVKIGDYGLSKHISVSQHSGQTVSVGTVHYMAPEIGSGSYTKAIDIYALGVILYEMLSGRLPFTGSSMAEVLMRHVRENADVSGIAAPFGPIIAKALAKDPNERYQDADEMLAAVMEHAELNADLESFDASALSQVPRSAEAGDNEATVTSPPRPPPVPPLDVREVPVAGRLPERLQRKLDHLNRKLEDKATKLERKFGVRRAGAEYEGGGAKAPAVNRRAQIVVLALVTVAIAVVLGLLAGGRGPTESRVAALAFFIVGGTVGPLFAHLKLLTRWWTRSVLVDRLAYASVGGLCMLPAFGIATDDVSASFGRIIAGPLAMLVLCNWGRRIETGREGRVDGWTAFWPAIIGLVVSGMANADDYRWTAAGVCAAIALLTQAAASMWPLPARPMVPGILGAAGPAGARPPAARRTAEADVAPARPAANLGTPPAVAPLPLPAPIVVRASEPSFVGRTTNCGLAFVGKLLLLAGLLLAAAHGPLLEEALKSGVVKMDAKAEDVLRAGIPPGAALAPLLLGSLLLVMARRQAGVGHFVRGCIGCGLVFWTALGVMFWVQEPLATLFRPGRADALAEPGTMIPLVFGLAPLALGVILLLWPRAEQNKPIVI